MTAPSAESGIGELDTCEYASMVARKEDDSNTETGEVRCRIALLTPYSGNNLGDAAIVDTAISHLRARIPGVCFSGISLNSENFIERHGDLAFPLCGNSRPFYGMAGGEAIREAALGGITSGGQGWVRRLIGKSSHRFPTLVKNAKAIRQLLRRVWAELLHSVRGYRFLRTRDLLIIAGGGQLDEEWGGPWGHPFALFKWSALARIARVPCAIVSVGAGEVNSVTSRVFLSLALRAGRYRSYRDQNTKRIATRLLERAAGDSVVPDLAFCLPCSELPDPKGIRSIAGGRTIYAVSPIAFAKPASWPHADRNLYERYLCQMGRLITQLLERDAFVVMVWSAVSDKNVISAILEHVDSHTKSRLERQLHIPAIDSWRDLVAVLLEVDFLVASRLHSAILGFVARRPTVAISFDPKVDWLMADLGQTDCLLQIRDFVAEDVIDVLGRLEFHKESVRAEISSYGQRIISESVSQFDTLATIAVNSSRPQSAEIRHQI